MSNDFIKAGRIGWNIPSGNNNEYDPKKTYERLDIVRLDSRIYALKVTSSSGNAPSGEDSDNQYWMWIPVASTANIGEKLSDLVAKATYVEDVVYAFHAGVTESNGSFKLWDEAVQEYDIRIYGGSIASVGKNIAGKLVIPSSVIGIDDLAFDGCNKLISVLLPSSVRAISDGAFANCTKLATVTIPYSVTEISDEVFYNCTNLSKIVMSENIQSIGREAFWYCTSLETIQLPSSIESIRAYAFYGCESLKSIKIPEKVTCIRESTFEGCESLISVDIPNSVKSIESWAFQGCNKLTVTIPSAVTTIGEYAFAGVPHIYYNGRATGAPWGALAIN